MSGGRPVGLRVRLTGSDGLVVGSGVHSPVAADASYSGRMLFVGLPLCDVYAAVCLGIGFRPVGVCSPCVRIRGVAVGRVSFRWA